MPAASGVSGSAREAVKPEARLLKQRVITALIAAPLAVAAIFFLPAPWFAALFALLAVMGLIEWAQLLGLVGISRIVYVAGSLIPIGLLYFQRALWGELLSALGIIWLACFVAVLTYPRSSAVLKQRALAAVLGWILLVGTWMSFVLIRDHAAGAWLILWLFLVVWGADVGAYFAGRAFGKRKLASKVSPGKTWEGVLGGMVLGVTAGTITATLVPGLSGLWGVGGWLGLGVALAAVSVLGDLFESVIKRVSEVKDSGGLLPGHGGWLDRIDAIMAAVPFFAVALLFDQGALI